MNLITYPNEILRTPSTDITDITNNEIQTLASDMYDYVKNTDALGLSACQVGVNKNLFICKLKTNIFIVINPTIIVKSGNYRSYNEGCLSLPGERRTIKRKKLFKIKYRDINGAEQILRCEKFEAAVVQHEMDHLNGKLIIDY